MKIDGGCHCGAIAYSAEVDPDSAAICHCTDCQTLSGTAFRTVVLTPADSFVLLSGTPKTYVKTAESGARRLQTFCPDCGTPLYSGPADADGPHRLALRVGAIRQRDALAPRTQIWTRSAQGWLGRLGEMKALDRQ